MATTTKSSAAITVVIGEDSAIVARGLDQLISEPPDMDVVAVAGDRDSLIAAVARHDPDVVVSDLRMPPTGVDEGLQVLRHIEANRMRAGFILFSQFREPAIAAEVLARQERGRGYLLKDKVTDAGFRRRHRNADRPRTPPRPAPLRRALAVVGRGAGVSAG